jgi:glycosyltransferase involved in cell wall biosynthesis
LRHADHVIVLTTGLKALLPQFPMMSHRSPLPISVIPTCVDLSRFNGHESGGSWASQKTARSRVYVYLGSVGPLYRIDEVAHFFSIALETNHRSFLLLLTNGSRLRVARAMEAYGVAADRYEIADVIHEEIPERLAAAEASVFLTTPCYSRIGKYPTKFGESLASGLPVVTNRGSADIDRLIETHAIGVVVDGFSADAYRMAIRQLDELLRDPDVRRRCRRVAEEFLSLEKGIQAYDAVYQELLK